MASDKYLSGLNPSSFVRPSFTRLRLVCRRDEHPSGAAPLGTPHACAPSKVQAFLLHASATQLFESPNSRQSLAHSGYESPHCKGLPLRIGISFQITFGHAIPTKALSDGFIALSIKPPKLIL